MVIGILIVLQIDNWNQEMKTQQRLTDFLTEIQNDLSHGILEANDIIDKFIAQDSILRNIINDKVSYSLENYIDLMDDLNFVYVTNKYDLEAFNDRIKATAYNNIDHLKNKDWSSLICPSTTLSLKPLHIPIIHDPKNL